MQNQAKTKLADAAEDVLLALFGIFKKMIKNDGRFRFDDATMRLVGSGLENEEDSNTLPNFEELRDDVPWVWGLLYKIPALITPGDLDGELVWLAKVDHISKN